MRWSEQMTGEVPALESFESNQGGRIYQLPLEAFPGFWAFAYLILFREYRVLVDAGSGYGRSNEHLQAGLAQAGVIDNGQPLDFSDLSHILITHGHIDHFGGLNYIRPRSQALLGIHTLDRRNLTNYEERRTVAARRLARFLAEAGVSNERQEALLAMYQFTKSMFRSVNVDFTYDTNDHLLDSFEFLHVPGHSAGHVVIRLHDLLFSGDHVLAGISPHQAPESLTLSTGLGHYLESLDKLEAWAGDIRLTLGGHREPIYNLRARIQSIRTVHQERLEKVLRALTTPQTIDEVSRQLFGKVHGYNVLLALEEAGAHIEYLDQRGLLSIENLEELEQSNGPVAHRYRAIEVA